MAHARLLCGAREKASWPGWGARSLSLEAPRPASPTHSRRRESPIAAGPGRPRTGGSGCLRQAAARRRRARLHGPPVETGAFRRRFASPRARAAGRRAAPASLPSRPRVASSQSKSASARSPIAIAGPLTGHGPSAARKDGAMSGDASAKPRRSPASPKLLPNERRTTAPRAGSAGARLSIRSVKIGEGLVDDEHAPARRKALMQRQEVGARNDPPVGIVRIDHDRDVERVHVLEPLRFDDARAGGGEGGLESRCRSAPARRPRRAAGCGTARGSEPASRGLRPRLPRPRRSGGRRRLRALRARRCRAIAPMPRGSRWGRG